MRDPLKTKSKEALYSVLNSYSQVFFSKSKLLALFLVFISFFDYGAGVGGLLAVVVANLLAYWLGYNDYYLKNGVYGFNSLLVGLGVGLFYQPSIELYILVAISAVTCFFITVVLQGVLGKYGLPFLSVPFLITIWIVSLSGSQLTALHISERGIYTYNEIYSLGGQLFVNMYEWLEKMVSPAFLKTYFYSLGAIFFQKGLLAGMIITLGLIIYSRISFVLSLLGFSVAYIFYRIAGIEFNSLGYTYIGFNYILTAIAIGGYYLVPGRTSFLWIVILLPAVVLITISTQQIFLLFKISPYSLPFNFVVLMFIYSLKLREKRVSKLIETPVQLGNPEKNLYLFSGNLKRFPMAYPVSAALPFYGEWVVSQGHNGEITHQGAWRNAWDFVINDKSGKQFKGKGDYTEDYYCFGKAVLAPADGTVVEAVNHIPDNIIGDINTKNNWGNTIIIKHNEHSYSKLSHLKYHTVEVKEGDKVKQGQMIGRCGNSGRSPFPHLHFQFQSTPFIGSPTLDYPFAHYLLKEENKFSLKTYDFPLKDQTVANPDKNEVLAKALHFIPGQHLLVSISNGEKSSDNATVFNWYVKTDVFNNTYIECEEDHSIAYLYNNGSLHYFTNYTGDKNTPLYWFFITLYMVPIGFLPNSGLSDTIPVNMMFGGVLKFIQDLVAPVYLFLKADYKLTITESGNSLFAGDVTLESEITKRITLKEVGHYSNHIKVSHDGSIETEVNSGDSKIVILCRNELE